jgi:hypothetical protein
MTAYPVFTYGQTPTALPPLEHVFTQLANVVGDLQRDGRSTRSAGIKPRLAKRLGIPFDEKRYGFATFREFLRAAQAARVIDLCPAPSGPDLDVVLPGQQPRDVPHRARLLRIRADFWSTFMDWTPGLQRAYDRDQGHAVRVVTAAEVYDPQVRVLLNAIQTDHARFVPIDPIGLATQTEWARTFAAGRPPGEGHEVLTQALRADRPLQEFTHKVRTLPCFGDWTAFRNERVVDEIKAWAGKHELTVEPLEVASERSDAVVVGGEGIDAETANPQSQETPGPTATSRVAMQHGFSTEVDLTALRARAHRLVDRMTAEELLMLPLTLGVLYRR